MSKRKRTALPAAVSAKTAPPAALNGEERRVWREWIPTLAAGGLAAPADLMVFAEWCRARVRRDEIERQLGGMFWCETANGTPKGHPGWALLARTEARLDRLAVRLGLDTIGRLGAEARKQATADKRVAAQVPASPRSRLGVKAAAVEAAHRAGDGSDWGDDLRFAGASVQKPPVN